MHTKTPFSLIPFFCLIVIKLGLRAPYIYLILTETRGTNHNSQIQQKKGISENGVFVCIWPFYPFSKPIHISVQFSFKQVQNTIYDVQKQVPSPLTMYFANSPCHGNVMHFQVHFNGEETCFYTSYMIFWTCLNQKIGLIWTGLEEGHKSQIHT